MLKLIFPTMSLLLLPSMASPMSTRWHTSTLSLIMLSFLALITLFPPQITPNTITPLISLDTMSSSLITLSIWISSLMILASYQTLILKLSPKMFLTTIISLMNILILAFSVNNFILFYIFFEASLIPTLFLILAWGYQPERIQASMYLMIYTVTASLPLLMSLLIMFSNSQNMSMLIQPWMSPFHTLTLTSLWWTISIMAFLVKMPLYFLHLWLPKAHVEAPVAGSMILAGILLKLGSFGLLRLMTMCYYMNKLISPILISISMWGAIITSLICLRQPDLKALIAYSSIGHMGIMTAGLASTFLWGWYGALILMLSHGLCSSALFLLANMTYAHTNTRSMFLTSGLLTALPTMTLWWFLFSIANMAAPPTMNLIGEIFLFTSILAKSFISATLIGLSSFLTAAYSLHLYTSSQHGPLPIFSNPMTTATSSSYLPLLLHFAPLILLLGKSDIIMHWIS